MLKTEPIHIWKTANQSN